MHSFNPYVLVVVEEQLVLSTRTLVSVSLPNSSGENYILLKVSAFPLLSFNSLITCYGLWSALERAVFQLRMKISHCLLYQTDAPKALLYRSL